MVRQVENGESFFLFGCDAEWNPITDTWHNNLGEAVEQAEFEYKGSKNTWIIK